MTNNDTKFTRLEWLRQHVSVNQDDCLLWPFGKDDKGYGIVSTGNGLVRKAHRVMCALARGEPPTPKHQAAHICGNGHLGCVNPSHLRWKTNSENQYDRAIHGTKNSWGRRGKLTPEQRAELLSLKGTKTYAELARDFGITASRVSGIMNDKPRRKPRGAVKTHGRWQARIKCGPKTIHLGMFGSEHEASAAYQVALARVRSGLPPR